jgi:IclR family transcriptional regulator, KDG regulon repressor
MLDLFDEHESEIKITDISDRMGLHKSTVHTLLNTLKMHGYIDQNPENGKYKLGMKLFERGNFVIHDLDIRKVAKTHLVDLSKETRQTTKMAKKVYILTKWKVRRRLYGILGSAEEFPFTAVR